MGVFGRLNNVWKTVFSGIGILFAVVSAGLAVVGIPFSVLFVRPTGLAIGMCFWAAMFYAITAGLVHPGAWERVGMEYPGLRGPMLGSITFMIGTGAANAGDISLTFGAV